MEGEGFGLIDKIMKAEERIVDLLVEHYDEKLGEEGVDDAWDEFVLWGAIEVDDEMKEELQPAFLPWLLFCWNPVDSLDDLEAEDELEMVDVTMARLYLEENPKTLDDFEKKYIMAACDAPYSFFKVTDVDTDRSMVLEDMMLGGTVTIADQAIAKAEYVGSIVYAKVVRIAGESVLLGTFPVLIPSDYQKRITDFRKSLKGPGGDVNPTVLHYFETELRELYLKIFREIANPITPLTVNTDGESLVHVKLTYALSCRPVEAFEALASLASGMTEKELLEEAVYNDSGDMIFIRFDWRKKGSDGQGEGYTVLGYVQIEENRLSVNVNSEERAGVIKEEIERRLGKKASYSGEERASLGDVEERGMRE